MLKEQQILITIKKQILEILPGATVWLFGSRLTNNVTDESDWDILILADTANVSPSIKQAVHDKIFPFSVVMGSFLNLLIVSKDDWQHNPSYYSLKQSIGNNHLIL